MITAWAAIRAAGNAGNLSDASRVEGAVGRQTTSKHASLTLAAGCWLSHPQRYVRVLACAAADWT